MVELVVVQRMPIGRILVVTLSRDAAAAMRQRVRELLVRLLGLRETTTKLSVAQCWVLDDSARERIRRTLLDFDQASFGTLQDWANDVVRDHPFIVHALFERTPQDERTLFSLALDDVLRGETYEPYLSAWTEVKRSSRRELEEVLYRAARVKGRLSPAFDPQALLRAARAFPEPASCEPVVSEAFPRTALEKLQRGLAQLQTALGKNDVPGLLAVLEGLDLVHLGEKVPSLAAPARALDREAVPLAAAAVAVILPPVLERARRMKRESGLESGEDGLERLLDALDGPRGAELVRVLRERHHAVLVDELQDADEAQWLLIQKVFLDASGRPLLRAAGDPRSAEGDVDVYFRAKGALSASGALVPLTESFRTTPDLVEGLNLILDPDTEHPFFTGPARCERPLSPGRSTTRLVGADLADEPPVILLRSEGDHARRHLGAGIADEIRSITTEPERLLSYGERGGEQLLRREDILVLTSSDAEADELVEALELRGIDAVLHRRDGPFPSRAASDVLSLLKAVESPGDRAKCVGALLTPFFAWSLRDIARAGELGERHSGVRRLREWRTLSERRSHRALFDRILADSGLLLRARFSPELERTAAGIVHLFDVLSQEERTSRAALSELVSALEDYADGRARPARGLGGVERPSAADAVRVSTLETAKGLEAPIVFLYAFAAAPAETVHRYRDPESGEPLVFVGDRRRAPLDVRAAIEREELERSQRLLYVGLTRARARLYLPLVPDVLAKRGAYAPLHHRLQDLLGVFPIKPASNGAPSKGRRGLALETWTPPAALLEEPPLPAEVERPQENPAARVHSIGEDACVREVVLTVPLESFEGRSLSEWARSEEVERTVLRALRVTGVDRRLRADVERRAFTALNAPVSLGAGSLEAGLRSARDPRRGVEYVLARPPGDLVSGVIDFLFWHENLLYLCDFGHEPVDRSRRSGELCFAAIRLLGIATEQDYLARFAGLLLAAPADLGRVELSFGKPGWLEIPMGRERELE
jgi:exodeoxyribonuclease V beta subunit